MRARAIDDTPHRIAMIGDSMVHNLLPVVADYCHQNGHTLGAAIWWGSTTTGWASSPKLSEVLYTHRPTMVLMVLGSSEVFGEGVEPMVEKAVARIRKRLGDRKLLWIGPPNWCPDTGVNNALARALGPGHYFRSAELELERETDGIHPTPQAGRVWAEHIVTWWRDESALPIRLETPTQRAPRPRITSFGAAWESEPG